jgi:uncharacterized protein (DUF2267 family)
VTVEAFEWAALFKIFQSWGPSAISSVLVTVTLFLIRKVNANGEQEKARAENLKAAFGAEVKNLREDVYKVLEDHGRKISYTELEYVRRETFYRELGGWKDDINRLSGQISALSSEFNKNVIDLWKNRKEQ